jgi:chemotaxis protein MotB
MHKTLKKLLFTSAVATLTLLNGCVSETKYNDLNAQYQQLQGEFSADQAKIELLEGELKITLLDKVLFSEGGFTLNAPSKKILSKLIPTLTGLQQTKIIVNGYTDNVPIGPRLKRQGITSNLVLSSRRADVVVEFLTQQGVKQNLLSAQGFGESNPAASNDTAEGKSQNRRIEVTLVGSGN